MKTKIIFGIGFTLIGISIIMEMIGMPLRFSWFGFLLLILSPFIMVTSLMDKEWGGVFFPIAILIIYFKSYLGITGNILLPALFAALCLTIGFSILFPRKKRVSIKYRYYSSPNQDDAVAMDGDDIKWHTNLSDHSRFIRSNHFTNGDFSCSLGNLTIYMNQATINPSGANIQLDCNLGAITLVLPSTCRIENNISVSLGDVNIDYPSYIDVTGPLVVLNGNVSLGSISIVFK